MGRAALSVAVAGFLVLAVVGTCAGVSPFVCSQRALVGAAVLYVLVKVAGRMVLSMAVDTLLGTRGRPTVKDKAGGHTG